MQKLDFTVSEEFDNARLDVFLAAMLENMSRNAVSRLLEDGAVTICDRICKKNKRVRVDDEYEVTIPQLRELNVDAENIPLCIAYEDSDVIVINKPKDMVVHPAAGNYTGTLVNALLYYCKDDLSGINGVMRPGIVHRIDKDTSGLLIVAKNDIAHNGLAQQLKDHSMYRIYNAIVIGTPRDNEGTIDAPIGRNPNDRKKMAVTPNNSKRAVTHYKVIEQFEGYSLVECRLETGRTHQIRVHMAHIGHPVLGDELYGGLRDRFKTDGQCLHAKTLSFIHPITGEKVVVTSELPEYFENILTKLRK